MGIICDRCGREMNDLWEIEGMPGDGGNCTDCGDNLCAECGGKWGEDGECELCSLTLEELEFRLPLDVQRREKMSMPCANCTVERYEYVTYKQAVWRSDDYGIPGIRDYKTRTYEISFREEHNSQKVLFRTDRYHSLRKALIEAHITLSKMGLNQREEKNAD